MKRALCSLLAAAVLLGLAGCGPEEPVSAADGAAWDEDWTLVGLTLGVEEPGHGLTLRDNNDILAAGQMFYATWSIGEAQDYTNADGEEVDLYDAHLYLLLEGCAGGEEARAAVDQWLDMAEERYDVTGTAGETFNGQDYTVVTYELDSETNPYARGVSAFGVYGQWAVSAELTAQADFQEDLHDILSDFLEGCHYNAAQKEA